MSRPSRFKWQYPATLSEIASEVGLGRLPHKIFAADRVNPTCGDEPGDDSTRE
jgi:hypothetical protein